MAHNVDLEREKRRVAGIAAWHGEPGCRTPGECEAEAAGGPQGDQAGPPRGADRP